MKILSLVLLLFFSTCLHAEPFITFGDELEIDRNTLQIDNQCRLKVTNEAGKSRLIKLILPKSPACKFVLFGKTNVIQFERVGTSYIFFIELQTGSGDKCRSKYVAVAASRDGTITTSADYGGSGTCPPTLEHEFYSFSHRMKIPH